MLQDQAIFMRLSLLQAIDRHVKTLYFHSCRKGSKDYRCHIFEHHLNIRLYTLAWTRNKYNRFFTSAYIQRVMNFKWTRIRELGIHYTFILDLQARWDWVSSRSRNLNILTYTLTTSFKLKSGSLDLIDIPFFSRVDGTV